MSSRQNTRLIETLVPPSIEGEKRNLFIRIIQEWRKRLRSDDSKKPRVVFHSLERLDDKLSLAVIPLAASAGVMVPQISERSSSCKRRLADYFCVIFGAQTALSLTHIRDQLFNEKAVVFSLPEPLKPFFRVRGSSGRMFSFCLGKMGLRERTGFLISFVYLCGADSVVFDMRVGQNSFIRTHQEGRALARCLKNACRRLGIRSCFFLRAEDYFIGQCVGDSLETWEAVEVLRGRGPLDLRKMAIDIAAEMVWQARLPFHRAEIRKELKRKIVSGEALQKLKTIIAAQSGDPLLTEHSSCLSHPEARKSIVSEEEGFVHGLDESRLVSIQAGLDMEKKTEYSGRSKGFVILKKRGDRIKRGSVLAEVYGDPIRDFSRLHRLFHELFVIKPDPPCFQPLIIEKIRDEELS